MSTKTPFSSSEMERYLYRINWELEKGNLGEGCAQPKTLVDLALVPTGMRKQYWKRPTLALYVVRMCVTLNNVYQKNINTASLTHIVTLK